MPKPKNTVQVEDGEVRVRRQTLIPILDLYRNKGYITPIQYSAGLELYRLFFYGLVKSMGVKQQQYEREDVGTHDTLALRPGETKIDCFTRYLNASQAIGAPAQSELVRAVCCFDQTVDEIRVGMGYKSHKKNTALMQELKSGLDRLDKHLQQRRSEALRELDNWGS